MKAKVRRRPGDPRLRAAVQALRDAHAMGHQILVSCPRDTQTYGQRAIEKAAAEYGLNPDTARKLRVFADPQKGYTVGDLDALCDLCVENEYVVGVSFITKFITIPDRAKRAVIQRQAIEGRWSLAKVEIELVQRFGRRRRAGRKPRIPEKLPDLLAELETRAIYWRRLEEALKAEPEEGRDRLQWSDLPESIRRVLHEVTVALGKLERAAAKGLRKIKTSRKPAPGSTAQRPRRRRASQGGADR